MDSHSNNEVSFLLKKYINIIGNQETKNISAAKITDLIVKYYESIISNMPGNVYWLDKDCKAVGCNKNILDMFGFASIKEFQGLTFKEMGKLGKWSSEATQGFKKDTMDVINTGIAKLNIEEPPIPHSNGKFIYFLTSRVPLFDEQGSIIGVVGISIDITERKEAELQLKEAKEQAELANQLKSQFISNMEHDIRTPASGVAEMSKQIATKEQDPKKQAALKCLAGSAKQLLDLLNNILAFDHIDSGDIPILAKKFNLQELLDDLISLEASAAQLKSLPLMLDTSDNLPTELIGDEHRLKRILINLLSNSIKFTEQGNIILKVESIATEDNKICLLSLAVKDTGTGISAREKNLIYEKFTRGTPSNKGQHKGMGLGLNIVKQFLADIDGEIEVESTVGKGTTFTCTIPFRLPLTERFTIKEQSKEAKKAPKSKGVKSKPQQGPDIKKEVQPKPDTSAEQSTLTILLVEDNELAQMIAATMLEEDLNIKVDVASTGKEALKHASSNKYDLILMDIGLPDTNGYMVTRKIRAGKNKNALTPIVALTAHRIDTAGDDASDAGMNDFLTKPLNIEKTQKLLDKLVYQKTVFSFGKEAKAGKKLKNKEDNATLSLDLATKIIGKADTAGNMIKMFIEIIPEHKEELADAFSKKDYRLLSDVAHKIIGVTAYTGTPTLKQLLTNLKLACLDKKTSKIKTTLSKVYKEFDKIISVYEKMHNSWGV
ncbi:MAG: response regulator [Gammaproteobacteria bacterium]|nr:response regulator [Gammaproteobacteria bacterium]